MAKLYRDYLFDNGASVYSALLFKYINPYLKIIIYLLVYLSTFMLRLYLL